MFEIVKDLEFDTNRTICVDGEYNVYIYRPSSLSARFKDYDVNKNFQIWISSDGRNFRPNHLRIMVDLYLRTRFQPSSKNNLLISFDNIFYGACPDNELSKYKDTEFEHSLNPLKITAYLHQLFIIEQDYCYTKKSNYEPPTLFYQGWIRQFMDSPKEIDNLCMSVCNRQPPAAKYTSRENKFHNKYQENLPPLWYLND
jgi:hypothetical protein